MRGFVRLYETLDRTRATNAKLAALQEYLAEADAASAAWAVSILRGDRLKRLVRTADLRLWAREEAGLDPWLFDVCYERVGDLAETLALVLDDGRESEDDSLTLAQWIEGRLLPLGGLEPEAQRERVVGWWRGTDRRSRFVLNKLLTGALRVGVAKGLVLRAVAAHAGRPEAVVAHRLMGTWRPSAEAFADLIGPERSGESDSTPFPFFLASPLEKAAHELGPVEEWQLEWKWDGIRGQLVRRNGGCWLWSRGEELVGESFPEIVEAAAALPTDCVLDGEILAWRNGAPLPFAQLQRRLGRKKPGKKILGEAPVSFIAYDLLEHRGEDLRAWPQHRRRGTLEMILRETPERLEVSPLLHCTSWEDAAVTREQSRRRGVEGLMVKRRDAAYLTGRKRGTWWKWKVDPFTVDTVLLYAQAGHGRRASLYTDYTLGVWKAGELVPVAKAYSGLSDAEIAELDRWIRRHTKERFGPVRSVEPEQVLEIAFEGIRESARHKSGVALRFPRIVRWRKDKPPREADALEALHTLLETSHG